MGHFKFGRAAGRPTQAAIALAGLLAVGTVGLAAARADDEPKSPPEDAWLSTPSGADIMDYYPTDARDKHISGRVELRCKTNPKGVLTDCTVRSEEPAGWKFGAATLKISHKFRLKAAYASALPSDTVIPLKMRWVSPG